MLPNSSPVGVQEPRLRIVPSSAVSSRLGDAALGLADRLGADVINLMPWQEGCVGDMCLLADDGQFAASAYGLVVARQNGKGGVLELRVIAGVTRPEFGERRIIWTAHTAKTARDAHKRVANIFLSHPDLKKRLKFGDERGINYGNDIRTITLEDGREIYFFTRSATAGRGLWADLLILDEALDLTDDELSVLRYTTRTAKMRTGRRAQTLYVSTPPDRDKHKNGVVFARLRKRALEGSPGVCWNEFSVPTLQELSELAEAEGRKLLDDPRLTTEEFWPQGNPSLGYLFDLGTLQGDLVESGPREFLVEGLAAGDHWPDVTTSKAEPAIDRAGYLASAITTPCSPTSPLSVGLEVSPTGAVALTVAGWRTDGRVHGELIWSGKGTAGLVELSMRVIEKINPGAFVIDSTGPAAELVPRFRALGIEPTTTSTADRYAGDTGLASDIEQGRMALVHCPPLDDDARTVTWRDVGDRKLFSRAASFVSLSIARHGLLELAAEPPPLPAPPPVPIRSVRTDYASAADLMTAGF